MSTQKRIVKPSANLRHVGHEEAPILNRPRLVDVCTGDSEIDASLESRNVVTQLERLSEWQ